MKGEKNGGEHNEEAKEKRTIIRYDERGETLTKRKTGRERR